MQYRLLDKVNGPADLKQFSPEELKAYCAELRDYLIQCCSTNPGHLGSSLGAVELIVGYHYVFDAPKDKIVFDVGHQAYAHKIITGRREVFLMNRKRGGISGFPKMSESEFDAFGAGHSSTSISAALGLATAIKLRGEEGRVTALIGDGALTGGLAFEGLNNAGSSKTDILVILNDNNFSIDVNIGAVHEHLLRLTTNPTYNKLKKHIWDRIGSGKFRQKIQDMVRSAKSSLVKKSGGDLFEALGFRYFGPVDGNDIIQVVDALERLKDLKGPRILHTITTKGKGYTPAECDQTTWHAPGMFDAVTGKRIIPSVHKESRYQDVFGEVLLELARKDEKIVGITPAMATGCGMNILAKEMPERFFDVGIEEEHAATFSAGLAAGGLKPFCNIYSSFSQRAYDQIIHDVALQKLGVVLCFDRGGLVGEDGPTHHGSFDMAAYRSIPDMVIAAPRNEAELKNLMYSASLHSGGPYIIRYPRGYGEGVEWRKSEFTALEIGKGEKLLSGELVAIVAVGPVVNRAVEAASEYAAAHGGHGPAVYDMRFIKPLDEEILTEVLSRYDVVITVEDGCIAGGLYGAVCEAGGGGIAVADRPEKVGLRIVGVGIPDRFIGQGTQKELWAECGLDKDGIYRVVEREMRNLEKFPEKVLEKKN